MRKALLIIAILSFIGVAAIYLAYPSHDDAPPPYYSGMNVHYTVVNSSYTMYYNDGCKRIYLFEGIHPSGSRLLDRNDNLLEENQYQLVIERTMPVMKISQTKYFTFAGRLHVFALPALLIITALSLLSLAFLILWDLRLKTDE